MRLAIPPTGEGVVPSLSWRAGLGIKRFFPLPRRRRYIYKHRIPAQFLFFFLCSPRVYYNVLSVCLLCSFRIYLNKSEVVISSLYNVWRITIGCLMRVFASVNWVTCFFSYKSFKILNILIWMNFIQCFCYYLSVIRFYIIY